MGFLTKQHPEKAGTCWKPWKWWSLILQVVSLVDCWWSSWLVVFTFKYVSPVSVNQLCHFGLLLVIYHYCHFCCFNPDFCFWVKSLRYQPPISLGQFVILNTMFRVFQLPCLKPVFVFCKVHFVSVKSAFCCCNLNFAWTPHLLVFQSLLSRTCVSVASPPKLRSKLDTYVCW